MAYTDAAGAFRFDGIKPDDYTIQIGAQEYRDALAVSLKPGQMTSWLHCTAGLSMTGAVAALDPPAVISGRVTDMEGEPIAGASVTTMARRWQRGSPRMQTEAAAEADEHGEYRVTVEPGRYFLRAGPRTGGPLPAVFSDGPGKPEMVVAAVVYPGVPGTEGATEFDLHAGQQLGGIDFKLPTVAAYHVRGTVRAAGEWRGDRMVMLQRGDGGLAAVTGVDLKKSGFDLAGVTPGSYWLRFMTQGADRSEGKVPVEVTDRNVEGVVLNSVAAMTLKGSVRVDDGEPRDVSKVYLSLNLLDWVWFNNYGVSAQPKPDGSFQFENVPAGEMALTLAENPDFYVESVTYNRREAVGAKLDLTSGTAGELEVVLGVGTGQIGGSIRWPEVAPGGPAPRPAGNIVAVLTPAEGVTGNTGVRVMGIDQEGRFRFQHLGPGRYFLWAVTNFDADHWENMDYVTEMQSRGVAVDLPRQGSVQADIDEVIQ